MLECAIAKKCANLMGNRAGQQHPEMAYVKHDVIAHRR
jgi:hypothetical protein